MGKTGRRLMSGNLALAAKILVLLLCAYGSATHMTDYWVIGPMFGLVVLIWRSPDVDDLFKPDAALFLAASTLIYALVVKLERSENFTLEAAVAAGTVLLAAAHAGFLKTPWNRAAVAACGTYIVWFLLSRLLGQLDEGTQIGQTISEGLRDTRLINLASIWQVAYVGFMHWRDLSGGTVKR
jgi:hypothetical protein